AALHGDYNARIAVAESLVDERNQLAKAILLKLLNDRNKRVVKAAVSSLNKYGLNKTEDTLVRQRLFDLAEEEAYFINAIHDSDYAAYYGTYVDRDKMVRLKAAKEIGNKFKGSMSIG
ncbi:MAG: HEAT repeat domain-containing protein, partial [Calditrichota bacterium]